MDSSNVMRSDTSSDPRQVSQRIWFEVGHTYQPRYWQSGRAVPEDWRVWVRGVAGADIAALVGKVVFQLRPDTQFPFPKRILLEAPFQHEEGGSAPSEVVIDIHLKCSTKPEQFRLNYGSLFVKPEESSADSRCIFYDVQSPSEQLISMKSLAQTSGSAPTSEAPPRSPPRPPALPAASAKNNDNAKQLAKPTEPHLSHRQMLLFESCDICDNSKSSVTTCPLLQERHDKRKRHDSVSPTNQDVTRLIKPPSHDGSKHNYKATMRKAGGPARRRCHRCLARGAPCPSCQSPRSL